MTEDRSDSPGPAAFSDADPSRDQPGSGPPPFDDFDDGSPSMGDRSDFVLDMARLWIKEHQTTTMLGAFAVGVFVGALFRE
jgi:hypothetical protein